MMAATVRGTPNFVVPPSQNTAPVDEFRCLYTHDLRKKQKKWHDGSLKFHTFNRRVMVYDDSKNFIGDLHYRQDDAFGEGVELQLDRGVLVEVGEPLGQTQTDLTALLDRHRPERDGASAHTSTAAPRHVRRIPAADTLGKPKSLAEVLGASQGRMGRVRLPTQSPYDQRHVMEEARPQEPPTKKRRIDTARYDAEQSLAFPAKQLAPGKENMQPADIISRKTDAYPASRSTPIVAVARSAVHSQLVQNIAADVADVGQGVVDISSDEEAVHRDSGQKSNIQEKRRMRSKKNQRPMLRDINSANSSKVAEETVKLSREKPKDKTPRPHSDLSSIRQLPLSSGSSKTSGSAQSSGSGRLKFASSRKARPKLMYKALLCASTLGSVSEDVPEYDDNNNNNDDDDHVPVISPSTSAAVLTTSPRREHIHESSRNSTEHINGCDFQEPFLDQENLIHDQTPKQASKCATQVANSPLFVSQTESQRPPSPPYHFVQDDPFGLNFSQISNNAINAVAPEVQTPDSIADDIDVISERATTPSHPPETSHLSAAAAAAAGHFTDDPTRSEPPTLSSILQNPPPRIEPPSALPQQTTRPFRRVVSESDAAGSGISSPVQPPADPSRSPSGPSPSAVTAMADRRPSHRQSPTKGSLFQRSNSDPTAVIPQPDRIETADTAVEHTAKQGPWTSLEAFLLFETWPEAKQAEKPVFEELTSAETIELEDYGEDHDDNENDNEKTLRPESIRRRGNLSNNFRSARLVLRDEI